MRRGTQLIVAVALGVTVLAAVAWGRQSAGRPDPMPGGPTHTGSAGSWAVAAQALESDPRLVGDISAWRVGGSQEYVARSVSFARAGTRARRMKQPRAGGQLGPLTGGNGRLGVVRDVSRGKRTCDPDKSKYEGDCDPPPEGQYLVGAPPGPLATRMRVTGGPKPGRGCRRRLLVMEEGDDGFPLAAYDGATLAFFQRVRCLKPRRRPQLQVVVRSGSQSAYIPYRGPVSDIQVAGRYLLLEVEGRKRPLMLFDLQTRRRLWSIDPDRATGIENSLADLEAVVGVDGTVLLSPSAEDGAPQPLYAVAPSDGRARRLPLETRCDYQCDITFAGGRFAYIRLLGGDAYALVVSDLAGNLTTVARFGAQGRYLRGFDFDGTRIAYATGYERRYRGKKDAGFEVRCYAKDQANVITEAPVIHTRVLGQPEAPAPRVPAPRTFSRKKPFCPGD